MYSFRRVLLCLTMAVCGMMGQELAAQSVSTTAPATSSRPAATAPNPKPKRVLATVPVVDAELRVAEGEFSLIALPDTQYYSLRYQDIFLRQTAWIKDNAKALNLIGVVHEGDITDKNSEVEWQLAQKAMGQLDGVVPYCVVPGNHDVNWQGAAEGRYTMLDRYFPLSKVEKQPWFGESRDKSLRNACYQLEGGGLKFLVVCLEFGAPDTALAWADEVIKKHADRRVIVVTHCYMNHDDRRVGPKDRYNPHDYNKTGQKYNDGEDLWEKLIRKHGNIFLVLSGHIPGDGTGVLTSKGDQGNTVHQVLANYQMNGEGGAGMLRILRFAPKENKIFVQTYSPWLKARATDKDQSLELSYPMKP